MRRPGGSVASRSKHMTRRRNPTDFPSPDRAPGASGYFVGDPNRHMPKRVTLLVFAGILAEILASSGPGHVAAAADCIGGPGRQAPEGSHWYYRLDRPSHRHCWYLGPQGEKARSEAQHRHRRPLARMAAKATSEAAVSASLAEPPVSAAAPAAGVAQEIRQQTERRVGRSTVVPKVENVVIAMRWPDPPEAAGARHADLVAPTENSFAAAFAAAAAPDDAPDPDRSTNEAASREAYSASAIGPRPMLALLAGALLLASVVGRLTFTQSRRLLGWRDAH
jgi:hypothetical protein